MTGDDEVGRVIERYARRAAAGQRQYSMLNRAACLSSQERQRALIHILNSRFRVPIPSASVLEIGCGSGMNLLELLRLGFRPENIIGNELLPDRFAAARNVLPQALRLFAGNAADLAFPDESFDIVFQSTVFTSLLSDRFQEGLAARMWEWVRPGGAILWYDFIYDNPRNPDVRGISSRRVRALFPLGHIFSCRVTLAPPIARLVSAIHPNLYHVFNCLPILRTHILSWIEKRR